ncbi:MAG: cellulose biosynthesis protein BcsS [Alphaproteobacteria bacterium]|nr:cellulose biosynthesis protein BcsS [Alphaproteobacteria bacterium]
MSARADRWEDLSAAFFGGKGKAINTPWRETWGGGELLANSWSIYSGMSVSLSGDITQPGWQLRTSGGYGQYSYQRATEAPSGEHARRSFSGRKIFSEVLVGHQWSFDSLTLKTLGGVTSERHFIDPRDPDNPVSGTEYGAKGALEAWLNVSSDRWLAADTSFDSAFNTFKVGMSSGYRISHDMSIGIEARFEMNDDYEAGRVGAFGTMRIGSAELTAAAGVTGDRDMQTSPYLRIGAFFRY